MFSSLPPHRNLGLTIVFLLLGFALHAQIIRGNVQDAKTLEPLPFANVFLNNTTIGTVTDLQGNFTLPALKHAGTYELIVSFVGYQPFKSDVAVELDEVINANVKLIPAELELSNVEIKSTRDIAWERNLKRFEKIFLGKDKLAATCKILNPWVIDFADDPIQKKFTAKAADPIEIYNIALGYKMMFYLNVFWSDKSSYFISGNVRFEEMQAYNESERKTWDKNRRDSYLHSSHHLFKAIVESRVRGEGFVLYTEKPDYENVTVRSANFSADLGRIIVPLDTGHLVSFGGRIGLYKIKWKGRLEVHYLNERAGVRTYRDVPHQVSWIRLTKDSVIVNRDGFELNPTEVVVSGDMSTDRVARMLPVDYRPGTYTPTPLSEIKETTLSLFQEKTYVHTDKPYYYAGEPCWFKGYMNYRSPGLRDSMSRTAYIELINPARKITVSRTLPIDSGFFHGDFILPDTLSPGTYYLRAYTSFSRNFGPENIFVKAVPVVRIKEKIKPTTTAGELAVANGVTIESDRPTYKPREKITLTIRTKDDEEVPLKAHLSMAVTDVVQVVDLPDQPNILTGYPVNELKKELDRKDFKYPVEYGISFPGVFLNKKGKPEEATVNIFQLTPPNFTMTHADPTGRFVVRDITFYDSAEFAVQSINKKGEPYGRGKLLERDRPALDFTAPALHAEIISTDLPQRIFSEYEVPKNSTLLEMIEVRATRLPMEDTDYRVRRPYGKPDAVLTAKDLNTGYGNLLLTLPGKIPGLIVRQMNANDEPSRWVVYLNRGVSLMYPQEVLVMVNNALVGGSPADILSAINPENVESVELKKGVNVLYGFYGGNGILAIYTKDGSKIQKDRPTVPSIKVDGYSRSRRFKAPDYADPQTEQTVDYRSLVYWNPSLVTDAETGTATVSFYATDLQGKYRITVEGVGQYGKPIRGIAFVTID